MKLSEYCRWWCAVVPDLCTCRPTAFIFPHLRPIRLGFVLKHKSISEFLFLPLLSENRNVLRMLPAVQWTTAEREGERALLKEAAMERDGGAPSGWDDISLFYCFWKFEMIFKVLKAKTGPTLEVLLLLCCPRLQIRGGRKKKKKTNILETERPWPEDLKDTGPHSILNYWRLLERALARSQGTTRPPIRFVH